MPTQKDFEIWIGNDFQRLLTLKDASGAVVDLTGATLVFRAINSANTQIFRKELTVATPASGQALLSISAIETRDMPTDRSLRYEVEHRAGGIQTTLLYGNLNAKGGVNDD